MRENITVEQAIKEIQEHTEVITDTEEAGILQLSGRILAQNLCASFDNPPFDRSAIDGYACKAADIKDASEDHPARLHVVREIDAGQYDVKEIKEGQAVRIMTGAAIPPGCDCCIRQEDTDCGENMVFIYRRENTWGNYCFRGEEFKRGQLILKKGTRLGFVESGVLAGMGQVKAPVFRLPRVAVFTTGDEVTEPGRPLLPGKIYNSNRFLLTARLMDFGVQVIESLSVEDDPFRMAKAMEKVAQNADVILTTGAVSVGKKDIMHETLHLLRAEPVFKGVKMKPGMPTIFSLYHGIPILSMSGNPFGVAVTVELLVRPLLRKMKQDDTLKLTRVQGRMADTFRKAGRQRRFVRAFWEKGVFYLPNGMHSNGVLASMAGCNCLIDIPSGHAPLQQGEQAEAFLL